MAKLPKKPRMPKESAALSTWENFQTRMKEWKKKCSDIETAKKRKKAIIAAAKKA